MTEPEILTPKEACGCGLLLGTLVAIAVAAYLLCGCRTYTVVPADREVVPVRQTAPDAADREVVPVRQTAPDAAADRRTYVEADKDATGWYVPDSVMLELLDAE